MFNFGYITKKDIKEHNHNWLEIADHQYRILIAGRFGSGSGKTNALLNLINHNSGIDIFLYAKDPYESKYQLLNSKRKITFPKHLNDSKAFIEYPNDIDDIYKKIEEYNPNKK